MPKNYTRDELFQEACARIAATGQSWNDLPGAERDAAVQQVEKEWSSAAGESASEQLGFDEE